MRRGDVGPEAAVREVEGILGGRKVDRDELIEEEMESFEIFWDLAMRAEFMGEFQHSVKITMNENDVFRTKLVENMNYTYFISMTSEWYIVNTTLDDDRLIRR